MIVSVSSVSDSHCSMLQSKVYKIAWCKVTLWLCRCSMIQPCRQPSVFAESKWVELSPSQTGQQCHMGLKNWCFETVVWFYRGLMGIGNHCLHHPSCQTVPGQLLSATSGDALRHLYFLPYKPFLHWTVKHHLPWRTRMTFPLQKVSHFYHKRIQSDSYTFCWSLRRTQWDSENLFLLPQFCASSWPLIP